MFFKCFFIEFSTAYKDSGMGLQEGQGNRATLSTDSGPGTLRLGSRGFIAGLCGLSKGLCGFGTRCWGFDSGSWGLASGFCGLGRVGEVLGARFGEEFEGGIMVTDGLVAVLGRFGESDGFDELFEGFKKFLDSVLFITGNDICGFDCVLGIQIVFSVGSSSLGNSGLNDFRNVVDFKVGFSALE